MVSLSAKRTCATLAAVCVLGIVACEMSESIESGPGAMPKTRTGITPRLNASTFLAHGELLERRGELERAVVQYQRALELAPDLVAARNRLGVTLNKLGRHAEATEQFRKALRQRPQLAYLHNNLGFSLYLQERHEEAVPALARAVELQPTFRRARMNYGLILARMGRYGKAWEQFVEAGTKADAHYNIAIIQADAGEYKLAACSLEDALRENPQMTAARDQLREIARLAAVQEAAEAEAARIAAEAAESQRLAELEAEALELAATEAEAAQLAAQNAEEMPVETLEESSAEVAVAASPIVPAKKTHATRPAYRECVFKPVARWDVWAKNATCTPHEEIRIDPVVETEVDSAALVSLTPRVVSAADNRDRIACVIERLETALTIVNTAEQVPIVAPAFEHISMRLEELYDDLVYTITSEHAGSEACLKELETLLGLTEQPY